MPSAPTHALLEDQGRVVGLWLRNLQDTEDRIAMASLLIANDADRGVCARILEGFYEVRANDGDEAGGYFVLVTERDPRIAEPSSTSGFVSLVVGGAVLVECEATILDAIRAYDEIGRTLKGRGMATSNVVRHRERCFSAVCVKCHALLNGAALGTVDLLRAENDGAPITNIARDRGPSGTLTTVAQFSNGHSVGVIGPGRALLVYIGKGSSELCDSERVSMRWTVAPKEQDTPDSPPEPGQSDPA